MKNFNYNVNTYCADGDEMTFRTNSIKSALDAFFASAEDGHHTDIVNGFTGEVLAIANTDEPWVTDEMSLMMLGHMCAEAWGEEDEDEDAEFCQSCGGEVVDGVCQFCGRCVECEDENEGVTAENVVLALLQAMGGLPS